MPKSISWKKLVLTFKKLGFEGPHAGGRHLFMRKGDLKVRVGNPHDRDISAYLLAEILRQSGITSSEWNNVLKK